MCDKMQFSEYLIFKQHIKQIKEMTLSDMAGAEGQGLLSSFIPLPLPLSSWGIFMEH